MGLHGRRWGNMALMTSRPSTNWVVLRQQRGVVFSHSESEGKNSSGAELSLFFHLKRICTVDLVCTERERGKERERNFISHKDTQSYQIRAQHLLFN